MHRIPATALVLLLLVASLNAAEGLALDATKYPQDTPVKSLESMVKALEGQDYGYYISYMVLPDDNKRVLSKYGSLEKYVESKKAPEGAPGMAAMASVMKKLLAEAKPQEGEVDGIKWARFEGDGQLLLLQKLQDGRWVMNLRPTAGGKK